MAKSNIFSINLLKLLFNNTPLANIGDVAGLPASVTEGFVYLVLFETIPTASSPAGTEATYPEYLRIGVPRNSTDLLVGTTDPITVKNVNTIVFPTSSVTTANIVGAGISFTAGGNCEFYGTFAQPIGVVNGAIPTMPLLQFKLIEY